MASPIQETETLCLWCGEVLEFVPGRGWVHADGGGTYTMYCPRCEWKGSPYPSPANCPRCNYPGLRDHHCAIPQAESKVTG